ncbi:hypothetical protein [Brevundimonas naejangsanensis]|uniref:capsular polysaccharide export protein, LipB/KpsS family n=1 Tax=Brevundimonas naejangsanensis TaxID=588932 RepID=UPI0003F54762|nr:hypothetical protein [Brevundimonas naejangsanensis]
MHPDNPLQIFKAAYRYAAAPISRWRPKGKPRAFFFGPRRRWAEVLASHPESRFVFRTIHISAFEFYASIAPWILSDRRSIVLVEGDAPSFLKHFSRAYRVPLSEITAVEEEQASPQPQTGGDTRPPLPSWFQRSGGPNLASSLSKERPKFLYMPWIPEHGDRLIESLSDPAYQLVRFDLIKDVDDNEVRRNVLHFARSKPHLYRKMVIRRLIPLRNQISGFIFTFDWAPVMRLIVEACQQLGIPTILIPHESVFVNRDLYYVDPVSKASRPLCDVILGWGELQRTIFLERGYPAERFHAVGAPKFDRYFNYQPSLDRDAFHRIFGLNSAKKTILFASQPLDSQTDTALARQAQRAAIADLLEYARDRHAQLLVRLPPSKDDIVGQELTRHILVSGLAAIDDAECYLVDAEEAVHHADVVTSMNSTMLFEAMLAGRPSLSMKYIEFQQVWEQAGIRSASNIVEAVPLLDEALSGRLTHSVEGMEWAADQFGVGSFDGRAASRARAFLTGIADKTTALHPLASPVERLFASRELDVVSIPGGETVLSSYQKYLLKQLNARTIVDGAVGLEGIRALASAEVFLQWGIKNDEAVEAQNTAARALGRPMIIVEDGFIRSIDIGLSGAPGLSIILDDTTAYYDATKASRLEGLIKHSPGLTQAQHQRARAAIDRIVTARISKYNHAPDHPIEIGCQDRPKILVIDQRLRDQSVISGLADETAFANMLQDAAKGHPDHDIIVKLHPDVIGAGRSGYLSDELLERFQEKYDNLHPVRIDINPFALFDLVDEVYVATSGMGFEALMAGKAVRCYGAPFYSGWGLTTDIIPTPRRNHQSSIEDVFYRAYIQSSVYYNPDLASRVELEDFIDYIENARAAAFRSKETSR